MKRPSFVNQPSPLIVSVIREKTRNMAISYIRNSRYDGAQGYDLHISCLEPEFRTVEHMKAIIDTAEGRPILSLNYDTGYDSSYVSVPDEERAEKLLLSLEAGAAAIDMQGSLYDTASRTGFSDPEHLSPEGLAFKEVNPKEVTYDPIAVEKQMKLIEQVHAMGAEVLMSVHTGVAMSCEQVVSMAKEMEKRGIDILKIVTPSRGIDDNLECLKTNLALSRELKIKYHFHCNGPKGKMTRVTAPMFGSHLIFCNQVYTPASAQEQLHLRTMIDAFRLLEWQTPED